MTGSAVQLPRSVTAALSAVNPDVADSPLTQDRLVVMLSGFLAVLALLLAAVGSYSVTAHGFARRRAEIGIRMALRADQ